MPCNQVLVQNVNFENAKGHLDLLVDALKEQGYTVQRSGELIQFQNDNIAGMYRNGQFETRSYNYSNFDVDSIKQAFSRGVVKKAAKQFGWTVVDKGNNKFDIRKRV